MAPLEWVRAGLRRFRSGGWGPECPQGAPVPDEERCTALGCDSVPLTTLARGESATVTCLEDPRGGPSARLAAMGVLPGVRLVLVQRSPAFVFRLGDSELAMDAELAGRIRVLRGERPVDDRA